MATSSPRHFRSLSDTRDFIFQALGNELRVATPLGLGKPNPLLNLIYAAVKADPARRMKLFTALSLALPAGRSELEKRFLQPFVERHFGPDYPQLEYVLDQQKRAVPDRVQIHEFYMQAAQNLHIASAQREYTSLNYTHVARSLLDEDLNLVVQMVARRPDGQAYSLSCNPDLTLDLRDLYLEHGKKFLMIGVIHPDLPYLGNDAEVAPEFFDALVETPEMHHPLFALPREPLTFTDHMIGLYASQLIPDDGTLQIGIGSLSEAIIASVRLRQKNNSLYRDLTQALWSRRPRPTLELHEGIFEKGLYGTSEMVMDAFMHLRREGILRRLIFDLDAEKKRYLHGAFYLGSKEFYHWLRHLSEEDRHGFSMTRVSKVNDLYDPHEMALRRQRKRARFFNICMNVTLLGAAASETLEDGQVVSGVGGQYNFVAMSHELTDAHSILMLKSTHESGGRRRSNIVWSQGHLTIPRHLRDVVVTEYGIAFLRGRTDEEVIRALIEIADAEFQDELAAIAKKNGKLAADYRVPDFARKNKPEEIEKFLRAFPLQVSAPFPFGSDFTKEEENLAVALGRLQKAQHAPSKLLGILRRGLLTPKEDFAAELKRLDLWRSLSPRLWLYQRLVLGILDITRNEALR